MSEDKELLELAAKANGKNIIKEYPFTEAGALWVVADDGVEQIWHPYVWGTDALALAIDLNIAIEPRDDTGEVFATFMGAKMEFFEIREAFGNDKYAATRRAIVKAAAEIGRRMSNGT